MPAEACLREALNGLTLGPSMGVPLGSNGPPFTRSMVPQWASLWALNGPPFGPSMGLQPPFVPSMDLPLGPNWHSLCVLNPPFEPSKNVAVGAHWASLRALNMHPFELSMGFSLSHPWIPPNEPHRVGRTELTPRN